MFFRKQEKAQILLDFNPESHLLNFWVSEKDTQSIAADTDTPALSRGKSPWVIELWTGHLTPFLEHRFYLEEQVRRHDDFDLRFG